MIHFVAGVLAGAAATLVILAHLDVAPLYPTDTQPAEPSAWERLCEQLPLWQTSVMRCLHCGRQHISHRPRWVDRHQCPYCGTMDAIRATEVRRA